MITRRNLLGCLPRLFVAGALLARGAQAEETRPTAVLGDDGLYEQPWFLQSFLDLREDLEEAAAKQAIDEAGFTLRRFEAPKK